MLFGNRRKEEYVMNEEHSTAIAGGDGVEVGVRAGDKLIKDLSPLYIII